MNDKNTRTPYLSVVIPAYNEENRIVPTLDRIREYLGKQDYSSDVIVVDDGSTDRTASLVKERSGSWPKLSLIRNGRNYGKGYSVKNGFEHATGEILFFSDADLSTPIEEIDKLLSAIRSGAAVAIGSRALKHSDVRIHQPWFRELMGKTFNRMVRCLVVPGIHDTQCGFKAFTRKAAESVSARQRLCGFSFDVEMLFIARRMGFLIREVPVVWMNKLPSTVRPITDPIAMFRDLLRIRWIQRKKM